MTETHPYLSKNNGFKQIINDFWIKNAGEQKYQCVQIHRLEYAAGTGWVEYYEVDLKEVSQAIINEAWKIEQIHFDENVVTKEQVLVEVLIHNCYVRWNESQEFTDKQDLAVIMEQYKISE